jgi:predicted nuclease with TOPRIM domain
LEAGLKALRERYNKHQLDHMRLRSCLERKRSELDQLKKENEVINDQLEHMRKESDELKEKLDSYEKVNKVTRSKAKLVSVFLNVKM